jgi:hypothetical protein
MKRPDDSLRWRYIAVALLLFSWMPSAYFVRKLIDNQLIRMAVAMLGMLTTLSLMVFLYSRIFRPPERWRRKPIGWPETDPVTGLIVRNAPSNTLDALFDDRYALRHHESQNSNWVYWSW